MRSARLRPDTTIADPRGLRRSDCKAQCQMARRWPSLIPTHTYHEKPPPKTGRASKAQLSGSDLSWPDLQDHTGNRSRNRRPFWHGRGRAGKEQIFQHDLLSLPCDHPNGYPLFLRSVACTVSFICNNDDLNVRPYVRFCEGCGSP